MENPSPPSGLNLFFPIVDPFPSDNKNQLKSIKSSSINYYYGVNKSGKMDIQVASFGAGNQIRCQSSVYEFTLWVSQRPEDLRVENIEALSLDEQIVSFSHTISGKCAESDKYGGQTSKVSTVKLLE